MPEVADRYRSLARRFTATVDAVADDDWDRPSPCEGWTARDVIGHVSSSEWDFLTQRGLAAPNELLAADPVVAWPMVRDAVQAALDDPTTAETAYDGFFGATTLAATVDRFYAFDLLVHAWDIARATGLVDREPMPPDEVDRVFADASALGDALRLPGVCGPAIEVPDDADPQTRLLGFLGRQP